MCPPSGDGRVFKLCHRPGGADPRCVRVLCVCSIFIIINLSIKTCWVSGGSVPLERDIGSISIVNIRVERDIVSTSTVYVNAQRSEVGGISCSLSACLSRNWLIRYNSIMLHYSSQLEIIQEDMN